MKVATLRFSFSQFLELSGGDTYRLFVYVEGTSNGDDGVLAPAVPFEPELFNFPVLGYPGVSFQ